MDRICVFGLDMAMVRSEGSFSYLGSIPTPFASAGILNFKDSVRKMVAGQ